jgi:hypothetical protein
MTFVIRDAPGSVRYSEDLVVNGKDLGASALGIPELDTAFTGAKAYLGANANLPSGASTTLSFAFVALDSSGYWSAAAPTRLTVPKGRGGVYLVVAQGVFSAGAEGDRVVRVLKNTATSAGEARLVEGGANISVTLTQLVQLAAGDYLEMQMLQNSGIHSAVGGTEQLTSLMIARLGG